MARLEHTPELTGHFSHDGETYRVEDGIISGVDPEIALAMAEHPRIEVLEIDANPGDEAAESTFRCGVNDCSREVDSEAATCWQHD